MRPLKKGWSVLMMCAVCAQVSISRADASVWVEGKSNVIHYDGKIDQEGYEKFEAAIRGRNVQKLLIRSGGGDAKIAAKMASKVFSLAIDVEVNQYCFSACANYIFVAGANKVVPSGAILGFHGGITGDSVRRYKASPLPIPLKRALLEAASLHIPVYSKLKLNDRLIECSGRYTAKELEVTGSKDRITFSGTESSFAFIPSFGQLKQAGVHGIIEYSMPSTEEDARKLLDELGLEWVVPKIGNC